MCHPGSGDLLDAATELFHREGVHIGVEALCRTAGVSERSMYQLFGSKDEVLAAGLERFRQLFLHDVGDHTRRVRRWRLCWTRPTWFRGGCRGSRPFS